MISRIPLLQNVRVAAPCSESWDDMLSVDGDRVHHCPGCNMNVYNLSAMTQPEAEGLLRRHEGRLCVRYYQRRDGTVMTRNCPVGAHNARLLLIRRSVTAAALFVFSALLYAAQSRPRMGDVGGEVSIGHNALDVPATTMGHRVPAQPIMGDVAVPPVEPPIMGKRVAVELLQGEVSLSRQQIDRLMHEKAAPRIDVTSELTDHRKDVPEVHVINTGEKPPHR